MTKLYNFSHYGIISVIHIYIYISTDSAIASVCSELSLLCGCQCLTVNSPTAFIGNYC